MSAIDNPAKAFEPRPGAHLDAARRSAATAKGNRNRLAQRVISDMSAMWDEQGDAMLKRAAFHDPVRTLGLFVSIIPQRIEHVADTQGMSDERYAELMNAVAQAIEAKKAQQGAPPPLRLQGQVAETGGGGPGARPMRGEVEGPIHPIATPATRVEAAIPQPRPTEPAKIAPGGATPLEGEVVTSYYVIPEEEEVDPASLF